jgi:biopolymer transport protein ExbB/TolQ
VEEAAANPQVAIDLWEMAQEAWYAVYPLGVASVVCLAIVIERVWRYRGLDKATRELTREVVDALVRRDVATVRSLCEKSNAPAAQIFLDGLRWKNIALEDLDRVMATSRQEAVHGLRRGLWILGTTGSLAPYVGLLGTVIGILDSFQAMAAEGAGGFATVASGISAALVATAVGLFVAIAALLAFNSLSVRVNNIANGLARSCERFVQALLYVESAGTVAPPSAPGAPEPAMEVPGGRPQPV